jgi:pyruvate dehydrogenase E2 component (dihydrolipoamide acetyltransferase)
MATKVHMEALSPTMEEGQVVQWLKEEGDEVTQGEILAEIETDKATMELSARGDGILRKILVPEGGTAPVGEVIAVIAGEDEDISELMGDGEGAEPTKEDEEEAKKEGEEDEEKGEEDEGKKKEKKKEREKDEEGEEGAEDEGDEGDEESEPKKKAKRTERAPSDEEEPEDGAPPAPREKPDGRRKASPVARRLAEEEGLDLEDIEGSGPAGRIVKRDVEKAVEEGARRPAAARAAPPDSEEDYEDIPLSQMRKTIAKRLVESIGPVPHFFLTIDVDMSRVVEARETVNRLLERDGTKVSLNDIVLRATATALRKHPECNAHWGGDHVRRFNRVHLGVAVAIDDGLITPVIRDAHLKGLVRISEEVREMAGRAREKKLKPDEYTGATFSVSNLGMFGIEEFTAVINPPEGGILAVGAVEERPVIVDGELDVRPRMKITMSCDHRTIDGAQGSRFLSTLKTILEEPLAALV